MEIATHEKLNLQGTTLNEINSFTKEKLTKNEEETDPNPPGKVQGIPDFTFEIVTLTIAFLLIPSCNDEIEITGYIISSFGIFISIRLSFELSKCKRKPDIGKYTIAQIILSIFATIICLVSNS